MKKFILIAAAFAGAAQADENNSQTTTKSRGNTFNPDASVNFLTLYQNSKEGLYTDNGFSLQEVEMQFTADVDPYFRAVALLAVANESGEWGIDPEEVYAETLALPSATIKVGKYKTAFGKQNMLHTHAYPFIDAPLINQVVLGDEGWNDVGLSSAVLIPLPWYSEITLQAVSGDNSFLFSSPTKDDLSYNIHYKNLFDLNDSSTLELGLSNAGGSNSALENTQVFGVDLTYKFRPVAGGKYHSFIWSTEYILANRSGFADTTTSSFEELKKLDGLYSLVQYQFAERWSAGARYDIVGLSQDGDFGHNQRGSLILSYLPSEFSGLRMQYDKGLGGDEQNQKISLQLNISIGAHPAHAY